MENKPKKKGGFLMFAGLLLLAAAFAYAAQNLKEERDAAQASAAVLQVMQDAAQAKKAEEAEQAKETPELAVSDADGHVLDWPLDESGAPVSWPVDQRGRPLASFTDADGVKYDWKKMIKAGGSASTSAASWQKDADGRLLPYVTDGKGYTIPWPAGENGVLMTIAEIAGGWRDLLRRLLAQYMQYAAQPAFIRNPDMEMPITVIDGNDYIGVLDIPTQGLSLPIISEWDYPRLRIAPCRYRGSVYSGDIIIAGHNYDRHFEPIKRLRIGDPVTFTDVEGNVFRYTVCGFDQLDTYDVAKMKEGEWDLTLFTCMTSGNLRATVRCRLESYTAAADIE